MTDTWRSISIEVVRLASTFGRESGLEREDVRYALNEIQRRAARGCELIDQEIIAELKDLHPAVIVTPSPPPATLDDIL